MADQASLAILRDYLAELRAYVQLHGDASFDSTLFPAGWVDEAEAWADQVDELIAQDGAQVAVAILKGQGLRRALVRHVVDRMKVLAEGTLVDPDFWAQATATKPTPAMRSAWRDQFLMLGQEGPDAYRNWLERLEQVKEKRDEAHWSRHAAERNAKAVEDATRHMRVSEEEAAAILDELEATVWGPGYPWIEAERAAMTAGTWCSMGGTWARLFKEHAAAGWVQMQASDVVAKAKPKHRTGAQNRALQMLREDGAEEAIAHYGRALRALLLDHPTLTPQERAAVAAAPAPQLAAS